MKRIGKLLILQLLFSFSLGFFLPNSSIAAEEEAKLEQFLSSTEIRVGEMFNLTYVLSFPEMNPRMDFDPANLDGFEVQNRAHSQQKSMNFSFGKQEVETKKKIVYTLLATEPGEFNLGGAVLKYKGHTYKSHNLLIKVSQGQAKPKAIRPKQPSSSGQNSNNNNSNTLIPNQAPDQEIFLAYELSKSSAVVGEQINLSITLFSREEISEIQSPEIAQISSAWVRALEEPQQVRWKIRNFKGRNYRSFIIRKLAVFPTKSGALTIAPSSVTLVIGGGFFSFGRKLKLRTKAISLQISPLPKEISETHVGRFDASLTTDKKTLKTGEGVVIKQKISGQGFFEPLKTPKINVPPSVKLYPPKIVRKVDNNSNLVYGDLIAEYLLVPREPGRLEIKSDSFKFYDPVLKGVQEVRFKPILIEVSGKSLAIADPSDEESQGPTGLSWSTRMPGLIKLLDFIRPNPERIAVFSVPGFFFLLVFMFILIRDSFLDKKARIFDKNIFLSEWQNISVDSFENHFYESLKKYGIIKQARAENSKNLQRQLVEAGFKEAQVAADFLTQIQALKFAPSKSNANLTPIWQKLGLALSEFIAKN